MTAEERAFTAAQAYFYTCAPFYREPEKVIELLCRLSAVIPYTAAVEDYLDEWNAHYITRAMDEIREEKAA